MAGSRVKTDRKSLWRGFLPPLALAVLLFAGCVAGVKHPGKAFRSADYPAAVAQGQRWLEVHPGDVEARWMVARAQLELEDSLGAFTTLLPLAHDTLSPAEQRLLIDLSMKAGDLLLARDLLSASMPMPGLRRREWSQRLALIERAIMDAKVAAGQGDEALRRGEWARAVSHYREALRIQRAVPGYRGRLAVAEAEILARHLGEEGAGKAYVKLEEAKRLWPESPWPWYVEGDIRLRFGDDDGARRAFAGALERGLEEPWATEARAVAGGGGE